MSELSFPMVGTLAVFFVVVPALTLVARVVLTLHLNRPPTTHTTPWRFLLVIAPSLGPVLWLISASIHQSEEAVQVSACLLDHLDGPCRDVALFGLVLLGVVCVAGLSRARGAWRIAQMCPTEAPGAIARVREICRRNPALSSFERRIHVVTHPPARICTSGLLWPRVDVEVGLAERLSDTELEAALLHEVEHARARDPFRFFVAEVALSVNPLGYLLRPDLARYRFARETLCDWRAVRQGADALALASSIVLVAAPGGKEPLVARLEGQGMGTVRVRVHLLLGYASHLPSPRHRCARHTLLAGLLVASVLASPHLLGTGPLDFLHDRVERATILPDSG